MSKKSDVEKIINYLTPMGRTLTRAKARAMWGFYVLPSRISDIRKMAKEGKLNRIVVTERIKTRNGRSICKYAFA